MKKLLSFLLIVALPFCAQSQGDPARVLGTFEYEKKIYNYDFSRTASDKFFFNVSQLKSTDNEDDSTDAKDSTQPFFSSFDIKPFVDIFIEQMVNKFDGKADAEDLKDKAKEVFYSIKARLDFTDDEPVTAYLVLKNDTILSFLKSNGSDYYDGPLSLLYARHVVESVSVETMDGAIKNITVHLVQTAWPGKATSPHGISWNLKTNIPLAFPGNLIPRSLPILIYTVTIPGVSKSCPAILNYPTYYSWILY